MDAPQVSFARGEVGKKIHARVDTEHFRTALEECFNYIVMRQGGVTRRPGTYYVANTKNSSGNVRLVAWVYSATQSYVLEFGDEYIRFYTLGGQVQSGGSAYEIATPWAAADVPSLQFEQSYDVMYIVHPSYAPRELKRIAETNWTISAVDFEDGPYLEIPETLGEVTVSATGNIVPAMTGNTAPSGEASANNSYGSGYEYYKAFDQDYDTEWMSLQPALGTGTGRNWLQYEFASAKIVTSYYLSSSGKAITLAFGGNFYQTPGSLRTPRSWILQATNAGSPTDADWTILDTRVGETGWGDSERRHYTFYNESSFTTYRLLIKDVNVGGGGEISGPSIAEWAMAGGESDRTEVTIAFSDITDINGGDGFTSADVGRHIRLMDEDAIWHWFKITSINSTSSVDAELYSSPLPSLKKITTWRLGAFSEASGYPSHVRFFKGRLFYGNTVQRPQTVWGSQIDDYNNFGVSIPLQPDDAITITIGEAGAIQWLQDIGDLMVATTSALWPIGVADKTQGFSATNAELGRPVRVGASDLRPISPANGIIFAPRYNKSLHSLGYSFQDSAYSSPDISVLSPHIVGKGVSEIAYAHSPSNQVFGGLDNGEEFSITFEREQQMLAFARHQFGDDGELVSVVSVPGAGRDEIWCIVERSWGRTIELMAPEFDGDVDDQEDAHYVDCGLTYSGTATNTITGLDHLPDDTEVAVYADGAPEENTTVTGGEITIPSGRLCTNVHVGLPYSSRLKSLRILQGQGGGSSLARKKLVRQVGIDLLYSGQVKVKGRGSAYEQVVLRSVSDAMDEAVPLFTGTKKVTIADRWDDTGQIEVLVDKPVPCTVRALIPIFEGEP